MDNTVVSGEQKLREALEDVLGILSTEHTHEFGKRQYGCQRCERIKNAFRALGKCVECNSRTSVTLGGYCKECADERDRHLSILIPDIYSSPRQG